jgi:gamma-glutamylcyclotransferase (GGCT)/AIG2-like uncharacterized protein YtfP
MILNQLFENPEPIFYFAYGMLTDPEVMQGIDMVGAAVLSNYAFEFAQFANVSVQPGQQVHGTLWSIDSDVLHELDQIEGYPDFYTRHTVSVRSRGRMYSAQVYSMTSDSRQDLVGSPPSNAYIQKLVRGYQHAGLPLTQIKSAIDSLQ